MKVHPNIGAMRYASTSLAAYVHAVELLSTMRDCHSKRAARNVQNKVLAAYEQVHGAHHRQTVEKHLISILEMEEEEA